MPSKPLTFAKRAGMVEFPKLHEARKRLFNLPKIGKSFAHISAVKTSVIFGGGFDIEGRVNVRMSARLRRLREGRGTFILPFSFFPTPERYLGGDDAK